MPFSSEEIEDLFTYHPPVGDQQMRYEIVRAAAKSFAHVVIANTKPCGDQSAAIRLIREATFTANAAIALEK